MSQTISIMSKPRGNGLASNSQSHKPRKSAGLRWRIDGEDDQIVIVHRDNFALPRILNPVAAKIFLLADGNNSVEEIAREIADEFAADNFSRVLTEVRECARNFSENGILC